MEEIPRSDNRQRIKDEVLVELAKYLRVRNNERRGRLSFFDRPIVLTVLGTILLTMVTTYWSTMQHRLDLKYELLHKVPTAYQKTGSILNDWLCRVLWLAEELNKPQKEQKRKSIEAWSKEIVSLEQEYAKVESIDGELSKVQAIYVRSQVHTTAKAMQAKLSDLEILLHQTNLLFNSKQSLTAEKVKEIDTSRMKLVEELNTLKNQLLIDMVRELSGFVWFG